MFSLATCMCSWVFFFKELSWYIPTIWGSSSQRNVPMEMKMVEFIWCKWAKNCCNKELLLANIFLMVMIQMGRRRVDLQIPCSVPSGIVGFLQWVRSCFVTLEWCSHQGFLQDSFRGIIYLMILVLSFCMKSCVLSIRCIIFNGQFSIWLPASQNCLMSIGFRRIKYEWL